ncbi:transposase [Bradyrhizobium sp. USDA 4524]
MKFIRIGVDLAKNYFQVHALSSEDAPAVKRKLTRRTMREFFSKIEPCRVGMEACGSAHYWARELKAMGHDVSLMPPAYTKPYVKRGKNDAVDAEATSEAVSRPAMRFVPVKSADQQATLMLHKARELLVKQRTMSVNALRGHLAEFGLVVAKGTGRVNELLGLAEGDTTLPDAAVMAAKVLGQQIDALGSALDDLEREIAKGPRAKRDEPFARRNSRHWQACCLGNCSQCTGPKRIQFGAGFCCLAAADATANFEWG